MVNSKIKIRLQSFNHELLNSSCNKMIKILQNYSLNSFSIIPLPTHKRIYCVLRSPHVDKDSREHFEIRIHKRIIEICYDTIKSTEIFDLLSKTDLPPGVLYKLSISNLK